MSSTALAAEPGEIAWQHDEGKSVALLRDKTTLWQFNYGPDQPKPFFDPVALTDGRVLTWNQPPDHPWHHGLWFSWKYINGVNYWEPINPATRPAGQTLWKDARIETHDDGTARITMQLTYGPAAKDIVLTEDRIVTVSSPDATGSYHFDWTCTFQAGPQAVVLDRTPLPHEPGGVAWGGYAGLSVRLAKELVERHVVTSAGPVEFAAEATYRGKATAMDFNGTIAGRAAGIAICDHPANVHHPSPWYAVHSDQMSYFSPAVICDGPLTLQPGEKFTIRYRVVVHPDRWDADRLNSECEQFVSGAGGRCDAGRHPR